MLVNAAISNGTGFLACYLSYPVIMFTKRKPSQIIGFTLTLLSSFFYMFFENIYILYVLIMLMRFGITLTFNVAYMITTEMYPTQIRGLAFGIANLFGRIGTMVAAGIIELPSWVFMSMNIVECLVIIIFTFFLPETKGIELSDKIEEVEEKEEEERVRETIDKEEAEKDRLLLLK